MRLNDQGPPPGEKNATHDEADDQQMDDHHEVSASPITTSSHPAQRPYQPTRDRTPDRLASATVHYCRDGGRLMLLYHPGTIGPLTFRHKGYAITMAEKLNPNAERVVKDETEG